jgi:pilus assembly protein CpaC
MAVKKIRATAFLLALLACTPALTPAYARGGSTLSLTVDHGESLILSGPASSVFIANPDIADIQVMSPTQVMIFGKRTGETTFMATDSKGHTLAQRTVVVSQDLAALRDDLDAAIPGNHIHAKAVPGGIVLTGEATDPTAVADAYKIAMRYMPPGGDIINRVQISGSNQVQIRVRFAEVQRSIDNTLGFNWQNLGTLGGPFSFGFATGATGIGNGTGLLSSRPANTTLSLPNDVLGASLNVNHLNIDGVIDALTQDGLITILAEPNLTAMSGETANFLAGGEFPIPIPQGNGTISIEFKSYGISLAFTPTLLAGNHISLHVRPEVSELTQTGAIVIGGVTVPALTTRKAETTVEVASGESFAIAGLLDNNQAQTVNKFPILGDMPVLGPLFRDDHFVNGQTELVVIITPYIVKPTGQRLTAPTDGLAPPTETERLLKLRYSGGDPAARPISGESDAVIAPPSTIPVPDAAPALPVTDSPVTSDMPSPSGAAMGNGAINQDALVETPAVDAHPADAPPQIMAPAMTPPLVLHPSTDANKRSGGLIVE